MRAIKFRAKSLQTGEFVYGDYMSRWRGYKDGTVHYIIEHRHGRDSGGELMHAINVDTLGQFIGVTTGLGLELYEGDIVDAADKWGTEKRSVIVWSGEDYPAFDLVPSISDEINSISELICGDWNFDLVGNIHDNPDLTVGEVV